MTAGVITFKTACRQGAAKVLDNSTASTNHRLRYNVPLNIRHDVLQGFISSMLITDGLTSGSDYCQLPCHGASRMVNLLVNHRYRDGHHRLVRDPLPDW